MISSELLSEKRLSELKGIGEKTEKLFAKIGVEDLGQLLHYYPRSYDFCSPVITPDRFESGTKAAAELIVIKPPAVLSGKRSKITVMQTQADFQKIELIWYNMPYLRGMLKKGMRFVFRGLVIKKGSKWVFEHPEIYSCADYEKISGSIRPVYSITAGLSNNAVIKAQRQLIDNTEIKEELPAELIEKYGLEPLQNAIPEIHFPRNERSLRAARERVIFDEFFFYMLRLAMLKKSVRQDGNDFAVKDFSKADSLIEKLPYDLTGAQKRVWQNIKNALSGDTRMNMLVQGDVGSGKTIIAFLALISAWEAGYQCAYMAPTEVLAAQHYRNLCALCEEYDLGIKPVLLTGSLTLKNKTGVQESISLGDARVVIGTHALIQEKVDFSELGLVIIDEQHRFGVDQRARAAEKGRKPHVCVMSATPIPRTLALMLYGDLDVSVLDEMPAKRLRVLNAAVDTSYRPTAYRFIQKQINEGHQAYVICPMIEKNEDLPCESVTEYTKKLKSVFGKSVRIDMLHGRMSPADKEAALSKFADGETDILVSTTVVEVGVDVPNATVMMVENADRFGLAQLHQLRGRIGRGEAQSYCIFVSSEGKDAQNERLRILTESNDGFYIAEQDLRQRGQGDLFGFRQSGLPGFNIADPFEDRELLARANEAAQDVLSSDDSIRQPLIERALNANPLYIS